MRKIYFCFVVALGAFFFRILKVLSWPLNGRT